MPVPPTPPDRNSHDRGAEPLAAGSLVADRYEVVRRIGVGGMSTVYLARHREMDRLCALKVLHPRLSRDAEARDRFSREARNASRIQHPNVATVFDFGSTPDGQVYLVMEYVEGRTLGALLAERQTLPTRRVAHLTQQIAAGLSAAHALGIVHRDLKPDNVMVSGTHPESVKLVDFGIAKALESSAQDVTSDGVVVGTPEYMAPEQFAGDRVDHRSDIYSLGLVCYRMLTGRIPHRAGSARETLSRRLTDAAEPLGASPTGARFPEAMESLFQSVLARGPEGRPATAEDFASALTELAQLLPPDEDDQDLTVGLESPTLIERRDTVVTRGPRGRRWLWFVPVAAVTLIGFLWLKPDRVPVGPPATIDTTTSPPGPDTTSPAVTPPAEVPVTTGPGETAVILQLPTPEELEDPKLRDASWRRAEQIYLRADESPSRRAQAAFIVATIHADASQFAEADIWTTRAIAVNDSAPAGADRDRRRNSYGNYQALVRRRLQPSDPP